MKERMLNSDQVIGIIFDGDDTLWMTEPLYDDARQRARDVVTASGGNGAEWEQLQRAIDVKNVATLGYSPDRFPTSCVQAYDQLCENHGLRQDAAVSALVRSAARSVFERDPELVTGVQEVLQLLRTRGARLALLTKGDYSVQRRRVERSGLQKFFDLIRIVSDKSVGEMQSVVAELGIPIDNMWMVGNSVRSDVLPALEAGIRAIWIRAHVWEYERAHDHLVDDRVVVVSEMSDVPLAVMRTAASRETELTESLRRL